MRSALAIVALAWLGAGASAHDSWINYGGYVSPIDGVHCCGPSDCHVIPGGDISETPAGYAIKSLNEIVPYAEALPSEDQHYWRCQRHDGSRRCFFAPQPGS